MNRKVFAVTAALVLVFIQTGTAYAEQGRSLQITIPEGASDQAQQTTFSPEILPFDRHDTITWINNDQTAHSIASGIAAHPDYSGIFFETGSVGPAGRATITTDNLTNFAYYYFCEIHPWMTGKLVLATAPESLPETDNAIIIKEQHTRGTIADVTGYVHDDFAKTDYQLLIYQNPDRLIGIKEGKFSDEGSYSESLNTEDLDGEEYTLRLVYGLPTQVATKSFEISGTSIPDWIKASAGWWAEGTISDEEFVKSIEFLAHQDIIDLQKSHPVQDSQSIPDWLRTNAGWWAEGMISDSEFADSLQFLVDSGIVQI